MLYKIIPVILFSLFFLYSCSDKENEQAELEKMRQDSIRVADSLAKVEETARLNRQREERREVMKKGDTFIAKKAETSLEDEIAEGKVIVLTEEGETLPFKFEGSKVMAISMPDGKLYPVTQDGDKIFLEIPGKEKMERRKINGKIYLVDSNDNMYEVKMLNNKLIAVISEDEEVELARK